MAETAKPERLGRRLVWLVVAIVVVAGGWSAAWMYLRSEVAARMDIQLDRARARGIAFVCPDRAIGGWPFRIDISCRSPSLDLTERLIHVSAAALRATALIYQPTRVIVELDGPLQADGPNGEALQANWTLLQASVGVAGDGPRQVSVAGDGLSGVLTRLAEPEIRVAADHAEVHARPDPTPGPGSVDADLAARLAGVTANVGGKPVGPPGSNLDLDSVATGLPPGPPGPNFLRQWQGNGGQLMLRSARFGTGGMMLDGEGTFSADAQGQVNGTLHLVGAGFGSLLGSQAGSAETRAALAALATAFTLYGKPAADKLPGGRSLDVGIAAGRMKVGSIPLVQLRPLF